MKQIHFTYMSWNGEIMPSFLEYFGAESYALALEGLRDSFKDSNTPLYSVEPELTA